MDSVSLCGITANVIYGNNDILYIVDLPQRIEQSYNECKTAPTIVVLPANWEKDLSPWKADRAFRAGNDFGGGAQDYLMTVLGFIKEFEKGKDVRRRMIAGYSLSGLFALWAAYNTDVFDSVASVSGSLWYDGFADYACSRDIMAKCVYFSLGDKESGTPNKRMAAVENCTRRICAFLCARNVKTEFRLNEGGHFDNVITRIAEAIDFLEET